MPLALLKALTKRHRVTSCFGLMERFLLLFFALLRLIIRHLHHTSSVFAIQAKKRRSKGPKSKLKRSEGDKAEKPEKAKK